MNSNVISPWSENAELQSNNKEFIGLFYDGIEIAMGAPTRGKLIIKTKYQEDYIVSECAAASFIWSDDSKYFAYSEWTDNNNQIIRIIKMENRADKFVDAEFGVVQFESFEENLIKGIDSPIYMPRQFIIDVNKIDFE